MEDEVSAAPGWEWITVGVEVDEGGDPNDPSGPDVVVPSRLRVIRSQDGRPVMRVDVAVVRTADGGWVRGVTGVEIFGDVDNFVGSRLLRALGVDDDLDGFVSGQMRVRVPGEEEGETLRARLEASMRNTTFEPVDPSTVRFISRRIAPAVATVARRDRRKALDDDVERAAALYSAYMRRHERGEFSGKAKPVKHVADAMRLAERTAGRRIEEARSRGLLPATSPGKVKA